MRITLTVKARLMTVHRILTYAGMEETQMATLSLTGVTFVSFMSWIRMRRISEKLLFSKINLFLNQLATWNRSKE